MGLDFTDLDTRPAADQSLASIGGADGTSSDYNNLMSSIPSFEGGIGPGMGGIDLGFGLSMDFQHDWSEGANFELLEGFFFGGGSGGGAG